MEGKPNASYDLGISYNLCATTQTMGIRWNNKGYWSWNQNVNEAMQFVYPAAGYTGYAGYDAFSVAFGDGVLIGGKQLGSASQRMLEMSRTKPIFSAHAAGDTAINTNAVPGGQGAWFDAPLFSTTLTAPVVVGATTASVAACPTATIPASLFISDMGVSALNLQRWGHTVLAHR